MLPLHPVICFPVGGGDYTLEISLPFFSFGKRLSGQSADIRSGQLMGHHTKRQKIVRYSLPVSRHTSVRFLNGSYIEIPRTLSLAGIAGDTVIRSNP